MFISSYYDYYTVCGQKKKKKISKICLYYYYYCYTRMCVCGWYCGSVYNNNIIFLMRWMAKRAKYQTEDGNKVG